MNEKLTRLVEYLTYRSKSFREAESDLSVGNGRLGKMIKNNTAIKGILSEKILHTYVEINPTWWETGMGEMISKSPLSKFSNAIQIGEIKQDDGESSLIPLPNGQFIMIVPLVPVRAQAGYIEHYDDEKFIDDHFEKHTFTVSQAYRGKYMAFVVDGHSMDDGTSESIPEGAVVTGRDIQRVHWRNKLHLHRFKDYVIVHKDGIFVKRITQHDTDKGIITCHSINPDKDRYADFDLYLDECIQILNIVRVTQER